MLSLLTYLKPFKKQCIIGPLCKWFEAILELILPTIMAFMINQGVLNHDENTVFKLGLLMIIMFLLGFCFSIVCQYNAALASQGFGTNLRNKVFSHITSFTYEELASLDTSTLSNRLINDINHLQLAVAMLIRLVIRAPFIVIGAVIMSFFLDVTLACILVSIIPLIILILVFFMKKTSVMFQMYQQKLDSFSANLLQNMAGIRVIRAFVSQPKRKEQMNKEADDLQMKMMRVSKVSSLLNPLCALTVNIAIIFLLWNGVLRIEIGNLQAGTIIAFINYASQILIALIVTSNLVVIFTKASASAKRINEILNMQPSMEEGTSEVILEDEIAVSFNDVSFKYPKGNHAVLEKISFTIKKGNSLGIVGSTGSGKTTLANLLCRFHDAGEGLITLLNQDIRSYQMKTLHKVIGSVAQKAELFTGTIKENLRWGNQEASEDDLYKACEMAQANGFIDNLDEGFDTKVERDGNNFSGGQKQRLCIARTLLKEPHIIVFDDSFSALDFKTEASIREALAMKKEVTQIIISQRVGTIMNCERILVLEEGKIVGHGTHESLWNTCPIYQEICESQQIGKRKYHGTC